MISGLRDAILDSSCVPHDGSVELTVIQFGGTPIEPYDLYLYIPGAKLHWSRTLITAANAASIAGHIDTTIRNDKIGGKTPLHYGINMAVSEITGPGKAISVGKATSPPPRTTLTASFIFSLSSALRT